MDSSATQFQRKHDCPGIALSEHDAKLHWSLYEPFRTSLAIDRCEGQVAVNCDHPCFALRIELKLFCSTSHCSELKAKALRVMSRNEKTNTSPLLMLLYLICGARGTQQTCMLWDTADMTAVLLSRHVCSFTQQTRLLCDTTDLSAVRHRADCAWVYTCMQERGREVSCEERGGAPSGMSRGYIPNCYSWFTLESPLGHAWVNHGSTLGQPGSPSGDCGRFHESDCYRINETLPWIYTYTCVHNVYMYENMCVYIYIYVSTNVFT